MGGGSSHLANKREVLQADLKGFINGGRAAAAPEVTVDFSKWLEGRGSLSAVTIVFLTDITFPLKFPQASISSLPGAAWLWLSLLVFSPGQTRLPDILLCRSMWQRDFILFALEEQHVSCSCQEQLQTHKKARGKGLCQFVSLFVPFYCVAVLVRA